MQSEFDRFPAVISVPGPETGVRRVQILPSVLEALAQNMRESAKRPERQVCPTGTKEILFYHDIS